MGPRYVTQKLSWAFRLPLPYFLQGSNSPKFDLDFRPQSHLKHSDFETEQHIGNLRHTVSVYDGPMLCPPQIWFTSRE